VLHVGVHQFPELSKAAFPLPEPWLWHQLCAASNITCILGLRLKPVFFFGWVIVGISTVAMTLGYGVRHSFAVFFPPILDEFGWSRGSTSVILSLHLIFYGVVSPFSGALSDRWQPRRTIMLGAVILGLASASCGLANELWHFYLAFGIITPIGLACVGAPVVTPTIINWFRKSRGLAYGIAQMGGGLSFSYAIFTDMLISQLGWRWAYGVMGVSVVLVLIPLAYLFYANHPRERGLQPYGVQEQGQHDEVRETAKATQPIHDWSLRRALGTHQLWLIWISMTLFWGVGCYMVLAHQVKFAQDMGYSSLFAASIFGLFGLAMMVGQVCAAISDRIGREKVLVAGCLLAAAAVFVLVLVHDASQPWLLYVYALGFGFGAGLQAPTIFVGAADLFAGKHFGAINGMVLSGMGVGGALGPWLGGFLHDLLGSYRYAFGLAMVSFILSAIAFYLAAPRRAIVQRPA